MCALVDSLALLLLRPFWDEGDGRWERNCKTHTTCSRLSKRTRVVIVCPCFVSTISFAVATAVSALADDEYNMNEALLVSLIASAMKLEDSV